MNSLVFVRLPRFWVSADCNEGCQNPASGSRAGFCLGDPLGEPPPSATPVTSHSTDIFGNLRLLTAIYSDSLRGDYPTGGDGRAYSVPSSYRSYEKYLDKSFPESNSMTHSCGIRTQVKRCLEHFILVPACHPVLILSR